MQDLEKEIDEFMKQLPEMLEEHNGKYTVFKNGNHGNFWSSWEDALKEGYNLYGLDSFLIRQVSYEYQLYGRYGRPLSFSMDLN